MPDDAAEAKAREDAWPPVSMEPSPEARSRPMLPDSGFDKYVDRLRSMGDMQLTSSAASAFAPLRVPPPAAVPAPPALPPLPAVLAPAVVPEPVVVPEPLPVAEPEPVVEPEPLLVVEPEPVAEPEPAPVARIEPGPGRLASGPPPRAVPSFAPLPVGPLPTRPVPLIQDAPTVTPEAPEAPRYELFSPTVQPVQAEPPGPPTGALSVADELFEALRRARERDAGPEAPVEPVARPEPDVEPEPVAVVEPDTAPSVVEPEPDAVVEPAPAADPEPRPDDAWPTLRPARLAGENAVTRRGLRGLRGPAAAASPVAAPAGPDPVQQPLPASAGIESPPAQAIPFEGALADLEAQWSGVSAFPSERSFRDLPDLADPIPGGEFNRGLTELEPPQVDPPDLQIDGAATEFAAGEAAEVVAGDYAPTDYAPTIIPPDASDRRHPQAPYEPALVDLDSVFPGPLPDEVGRGAGRGSGGRNGGPRRPVVPAGRPARLRRVGGQALAGLLVATVAAAAAFVVVSRLQKEEPTAIGSGAPAAALSSPAAAASPTAAPAVQVGPAKFGVFRGTSRSDVAAFARWAGHSVDVVVDFPPRENWTQLENPADVIDEWSGSGYQLVLSTAMLPTKQKSSMAAGARGEYDSYYRTLARNLVASGEQDTIIRLGWEFNLATSRWSTADPDQFIAYWRNIVDAMRSVPGQNFEFDWNVNVGDTAYDGTAYYPGADYVDYVGVDVYDVSWDTETYPYPAGCDAACRLPRQQAVWDRLYAGDGGLNFWSRFAKSKGKPMSLPEWGLWKRIDNHGGNDDPYFITQMHKFITDRSNNVAYQAYFEVNQYEAQHSMIENFPKAGATFRKLFTS